jgi:hypothetical protein
MQLDLRGRPRPASVVTLRADNDAFSPDPLLIMSKALAGAGSDASAESVFLAWLMSLPDGLDPAQAAERLLRDGGQDAEGQLGRRLLELLEEAAHWPRTRLKRLDRSRRSERQRERRS